MTTTTLKESFPKWSAFLPQTTAGEVVPGGGPIKVCLLGVTFDSPNLGVGALLDGAIIGILHCHADAVISLLDYGREGFCRTCEVNGRAISIEFVNMRFSKKFYLRNNVAFLIVLATLNRYLFPKWLQNRIIRGNATLRHIQDTDVFASIAGGDSFSDIYGLGRLIYLALPQVLVLMMGKRLVLLPQTLGPFKTRIARWVAQFILVRAKRIYSRDYPGLKIAQDLGGRDAKDKIRFSPDVGFLVEPKKPAVLNLSGLTKQNNHGRVLVGLNVSGLLYAGGYNHNNMFGLKADYRDLINAILKFLIEEKGATVLLVPHVYHEPGSHGPSESDEYACKIIFTEFRPKYGERIYLAEGQYTTREIKYVIGMCDLFIGSRMHSCIAALSLGIPGIALSYSDKFLGVMKTIDMTELVADPRTMNLPEILGIIDRALERINDLRMRLQSSIPKVKKQIYSHCETQF